MHTGGHATVYHAVSKSVSRACISLRRRNFTSSAGGELAPESQQRKARTVMSGRAKDSSSGSDSSDANEPFARSRPTTSGACHAAHAAPPPPPPPGRPFQF